MATQTTIDSNLAELVRRYQVCWEVWPEICIGPQHRQVGYELELFGSDANIEGVAPGSAGWAAVRSALRAIAAEVFGACDGVLIEPIDDVQCLRYSPARGNRPDVTYSVKILHRYGYENPVDEAERRYLDKVKAGLRGLGASEHVWHCLDDSVKALSNA